MSLWPLDNGPLGAGVISIRHGDRSIVAPCAEVNVPVANTAAQMPATKIPSRPAVRIVPS